MAAVSGWKAKAKAQPFTSLSPPCSLLGRRRPGMRYDSARNRTRRKRRPACDLSEGLSGQQVLIIKPPVAHNLFAAHKRDGMRQDRPIVDEGVKLAALAARVRAARKVAQEI